MTQIRRTAASFQDLDELATYIQHHSADAAMRFLAAAEATFKRLAQMPELGQRQEIGSSRLVELRAWQVQEFENVVIFYRPIANGIEVIRVLHAARDTTNLLEGDS